MQIYNWMYKLDHYQLGTTSACRCFELSLSNLTLHIPIISAQYPFATCHIPLLLLLFFISIILFPLDPLILNDLRLRHIVRYRNSNCTIDTHIDTTPTNHGDPHRPHTLKVL